jgi:hypothetical protein
MSKSKDLNIDNSLADVVGQTRRPKLEPETGWAKVGITAGYEASTPKGSFVGVGFTNSWISATTVDSVPASWYLSEDGETRMRGKIRGGATNTVVFALPEEARPEYAETFICPIDTNGNIDLSGIRFRSWQDGDTEA